MRTTSTTTLRREANKYRFCLPNSKTHGQADDDAPNGLAVGRQVIKRTQHESAQEIHDGDVDIWPLSSHGSTLYPLNQTQKRECVWDLSPLTNAEQAVYGALSVSSLNYQALHYLKSTRSELVQKRNQQHWILLLLFLLQYEKTWSESVGILSVVVVCSSLLMKVVPRRPTNVSLVSLNQKFPPSLLIRIIFPLGVKLGMLLHNKFQRPDPNNRKNWSPLAYYGAFSISSLLHLPRVDE